jgi:protein deglycase
MRVLVPLAEGFEEIEAVSIIDVLRRAEINVVTAFLKKNPVTGSHGISITADNDLKEINMVDFSAIILPGGMPGSENLKNSDRIISIVKHIYSRGGIVGAICAAPVVLEQAGILYGKRAACFPGIEAELKDAIHDKNPVVTDGNIVTGRGPGCAIPFALELVGILKSRDVMEGLRKNMQVYWI